MNTDKKYKTGFGVTPITGGKMENMNKFRITKKIILAVLLTAMICGTGRAAHPPVTKTGQAESAWPYKDETPAQRAERMGWWRAARFGMFIHWGVYSVPAGTYNGKQVRGIGEWIMSHGKIPVDEYKNFAKEFNPVNYDPEAWVKLAKAAGMKYIVITSKHHDGFALFDSKVSDWDIVDATPYGKDLLKPLAEACRKHDMKLGFYYSQAQDWCHPGGAKGAKRASPNWDPKQAGDMDKYLDEIAIPQIKEILTNYGDIAILWWDTPHEMTDERANKIQPLINLQPGIITNDRLREGWEGDLKTPEQNIPAEGYSYDWESCMTMNHTWGYKSYDHDWKSTETLIQNLVNCASKGGNYLLNIGPKSNGDIPQESIDRLEGMAAWMKDNSESIYGTTRTPFARLNWGRCTKKEFVNGTKLYLHIFDWPKDGKLELPGLRSKVEAAYFLADMQTPVKIETTEEGATMYLPKEAPDDIDTVVVAKIIGELKVDRIIPCQNKDGVIDLTIDDVYLKNRAYGDKIQIETNDDDEKIAVNWIDFRANLYWIIRVDEPGEFEVLAEVATVKPTDVVVTGGRKSVNASLPATGSCETFQQVSLGKLNLSEGEHTITIKLKAKTGEPMCVKAATLKPVK
jgi:alpha-L-fucosidase